jgi:hypothetical protein
MTLHVFSVLTLLALTCTCFSITHAAAHAAKHIIKRTEIRSLASGAPGPLEFVELWVQSTTVLSVSFDEPEQTGDSRIDRYLIEWSLSDDFHEAAQGLVLVSRAVPMKSYQYDIVNLPHGTLRNIVPQCFSVRARRFISSALPFSHSCQE